MKIIEDNFDEVTKEIFKLEVNKLDEIGFMLVKKIKGSFRKGTGKPYKLPQGGMHRPSRPGKPPAVLYGSLRNSIVHDVIKNKLTVIIGVKKRSAAGKYARRLELGFVGRDSKGRLYRQKPRPYLRRAPHVWKREVQAILDR